MAASSTHAWWVTFPAAEHAPQSWQRRLEERLSWDFQNARQMHAARSQITLVGYGSRDAHSGPVIHQPCEVVYWIERVGGRSCLFRQEQLLTTGNSPRTTEVMAVGVETLHVGRIEDEAAELLQRPDGPSVLAPAPSALRCVVTSSAGGIVAEFIVIRGGRR